LDLASQPALFNNFVDFTSNLVENVFRTLVKTSREQLETYVDMVEALSGGPSQFIANNIGDLDAAAMKYLNEVVRPEFTSDTTDYTRTDTANVITFAPQDVTLIAAKEQALTNSFSGVRTEIDDADQTPDELSEAIVTIGTTKTVKLELLHAFTKGLLERAGRRSFDQLQALLQMGLMKVVPNKGFIETSVTFDIGTKETSEQSSNSTSTSTSTKTGSFNFGFEKSSSPSLFKKIFSDTVSSKLNIGASGSATNTDVKVKIVNEKSTAATNLDIDITGRVRIDFITDYFPLLPAPGQG